MIIGEERLIKILKYEINEIIFEMDYWIIDYLF